MKKPLTFLSFLLVTIGALAQGQVNFAARVDGVYDAPVLLCGGSPAAGDRYRVQLYAGPALSSLAPVGDPLPFLTGADAGYWAATEVTIDQVDANGLAFVEVRAWDTAHGPTYEAALTDYYYAAARSHALALRPTVEPDLPATLFGLEGFTFGCVPEPSVMLLAVLGSVPFFLRRQSTRR